MTIHGDVVPKICSECRESYWEEMCYGEGAFCGKYDKLCSDALKECDLICINKCSNCPRNC